VAAYNEEAGIGAAVRSLASLESVGTVVVVADGCMDRTVEEASRAGARVLTSPGRRGKGRALDEALDLVEPAELYLLVDGDVGPSAAEAGALLGPLMSGELDMAVGRLPPQAGGGFGLVKRLAGWLIRRASGFSANEPLSGQRAVTRATVDACRPLAGGFGVEVAMTIDAVRLGFKVGERPVAMTHRGTGRTVEGFVHRGRQGVEILRAAVPRLLRLR
jgi:hypothetical protein